MIHKLEADGILLEFGARKILSDIYLKCETGKITGILGRNGQGKTCLMNIIYGSLAATSKSIRFNNVSIISPFKRPGLVHYLPQFNFIPKTLTLKNIFWDFDLDYSEFQKHFPEFRPKYTSSLKSLSGGERRLLEVYIVIRSNSKFAMLDEPFSHLMPLHIEKVKAIMKVEKLNKGFLVTDHLFNDIVDISDDLYVLKEGKAYLTKDISEIETLGYAII